jgi:hypothetical protein
VTAEWFSVTKPSDNCVDVWILVIDGRVAATASHLAAIGDEWPDARAGFERLGYTVAPAPKVKGA